MPRGYSKEQICNILLQILETIDLNNIKSTQCVKDVLPNYNGELADWKVGVFLARAKRGVAYNDYYEFLQEIGLNMKVERTITKLVKYCDAIDKLVNLGININKIPSTAMMSDYIEDYKEADLKIGELLANARFGRVGKIIVSKLREHNFNFDLKGVTKREKVKQVVIDIAKVTDINKIPADKVVKDYIPNYPAEMADYKIGLFVQNARSGDYKELKDLLISLGFTFERTRKRHTAEYICSAIDDLINEGIDLNQLNQTAKMSDFLPSYVEDDLSIGALLMYARNGKIGKVIKEKLEASGFDFEKAKNTKEEICDILRKIAKRYDINSVKACITVKELLPEYQGALSDFNIGRLLTRARLKGCGEYEDILLELGFVLGRVKSKSYSEEYVCTAIRDLVKEGINLNDITLRSYMSKYIPSYCKNDCHIGYILSQARRGLVGEKIKQELEKYDFEFSLKTNLKRIN